MPNPFAAFLEEENRKTTSVAELERQRKQLKQHISMMKEKLKQVEKGIRNKQSQTGPSQASPASQ